jgi:predicted transcriptional regulator
MSRQRRLTESEVEDVIERIERGQTCSSIAQLHGVTRQAISYLAVRHGREFTKRSLTVDGARELLASGMDPDRVRRMLP